MADQGDADGRLLLRLLQDGLQPALGTGDPMRFDPPGQLIGPVVGELHIDAEIVLL